MRITMKTSETIGYAVKYGSILAYNDAFDKCVPKNLPQSVGDRFELRNCYYADKQPTDSYGFAFTSDITKAKLYSSKVHAGKIAFDYGIVGRFPETEVKDVELIMIRCTKKFEIIKEN